MHLQAIVKKNPLFFAFFFPALMDGIVTLIGQGKDYWQSSQIANDASPAYFILITSPWLFIIGSIIWFVFWYYAFKRLKEPINLLVTLTFIAGHSWGSSSWIMNLAKENGLLDTRQTIHMIWSLLVLYFIAIGTNAAYCLKIYFQKYDSRR